MSKMMVLSILNFFISLLIFNKIIMLMDNNVSELSSEEVKVIIR